MKPSLTSKPAGNILEWGWRGVIFCVLTGQLWVTSHFVSKSDFEVAIGRLGEVRDKVLIIEQTLKNEDSMMARMQGMTERLNALERESAAREIRIVALERKLKI